mmetsp:Transcript_1612/g.3773  ORF Transcript_1612/g.3773 Transcript_1612/m.3773 type:complete len:247 (-) Transcript_1612:1176-1916(-)
MTTIQSREKARGSGQVGLLTKLTSFVNLEQRVAHHMNVINAQEPNLQSLVGGCILHSSSFGTVRNGIQSWSSIHQIETFLGGRSTPTVGLQHGRKELFVLDAASATETDTRLTTTRERATVARVAPREHRQTTTTAKVLDSHHLLVVHQSGHYELPWIGVAHLKVLVRRADAPAACSRGRAGGRRHHQGAVHSLIIHSALAVAGHTLSQILAGRIKVPPLIKAARARDSGQLRTGPPAQQSASRRR